MQYTQYDSINIPLPKGDIRMEFTDATTGDVLDIYEENNIVVDQARECIIARLFENQNSYRVRFCKIGNDVGVGTENDPEEPTRETTLGDMSSFWSFMYTVINWIFFWQEDHCYESHLQDVEWSKEYISYYKNTDTNI